VLRKARLAELDALLAQIAGAMRSMPRPTTCSCSTAGGAPRCTCSSMCTATRASAGPAMIDLAQTYEKAGLYLAEGEMPDHLPVVLEFASTQPPREAAGFLGEIAHLINVIFNALEKRQSRYASVMGALLDLAGEPARPVQLPDEESIDEAWEEPAAFDGCHSAPARNAQARPSRAHRPPPPALTTQRSGASA
jgi:nitrate reductase delta subunit